MANDKLPVVLNKQKDILNIAKRYIDKLSSKSTNKQIIDSFTYIKQYGVLSMPAFRMFADEMIRQSPEGTIIMADINDLFVANKFRGKEKVNSMIKSMIDKIKVSLNENECKNYKIAKMGDEIYIYLPDKNEQEANTIVDDLKKVKENELTISVGSCSDLSNGLTHAMNIADEKMAENKGIFKSERLRSICGNDLEKIVNTVVETQLDKMRINMEKLKNSNKPDLRNTFDKAIEQLDMDDIVSDSHISQDLGTADKQDTFEKLKRQYTDEAKSLYGNKTHLINEYVLASMLSKHPVNDVISSEYFQGLGYRKAYKNIMKDKGSKGFSILAVDLSGLKNINDTHGHDAGDIAISDSLEHVKNVLKEKNIKMYSNIVAKGGGNSYVLIEKSNDISENEIISDIQRYGTNTGAKYNMSIICSIQEISKNKLKKPNFLNIINDNLTKIESNLQEESFSRKLKDVEEIKGSIKKIYRQIANLDDIKLLSKSSLNQREKILEMIKIGFKNCIEKEKDSSHLKSTHKSINLEKGKRGYELKNLKPCANEMTI
ncbi:MAG: hypothetical protein K0R72_885 [Clostridia bacterium]|jgi:GGDEF domain-containing protein|nr:hypothetical protein [Clostridia bacterium]